MPTSRERDRWAASLKRIEHHDPASRNYAGPRLADLGVTALRDATWAHYGPGTNQRDAGACTSGTAVDVLMSRPLYSRRVGIFDDDFMFRLYQLITARDPFGGQWYYDRIVDQFHVQGHGNDTGSSWRGMWVAMRELGLIDRVEWGFGGDHGRELMLRGPVAIGIPWRSRMFDPEPDGRIRYLGDVVGGHEIAATRLRVAERRIWIRNHWLGDDGKPWGVKGLAWMSFDDYDAALADGGDQAQFLRTSAWKPPGKIVFPSA
jgi:hypothetical protein